MLSEFQMLTLAAVLFVGGHFLLSATPVRNRLIGALGQYGFLALYSALALAAFGWLLIAFGQAEYRWVWGSPQWTRVIVFAVMPIAAMLVVAGYLTPNPTAVLGDYALKRADPAVGIFQVTRHPAMIGVALWAASHLLANGHLAAIILFGSLLILSVGGIAHIEAKKRASGDANWQRLVAMTSIVPFAAIAQGRIRFGFGERDWLRLALGLALYGALLYFHGPAFGIYLVGKP